MKWNFFENTGKLCIDFQAVDINGYIFKAKDGIVRYYGTRLGPGTTYQPYGVKVVDLRRDV